MAEAQIFQCHQPEHPQSLDVPILRTVGLTVSPMTLLWFLVLVMFLGPTKRGNQPA